MIRPLVADSFRIPENLRTDRFRFEILAPVFAEPDYDAVMSSRSRLRNVFRENDEWPGDSMSFEANVRDLERHESEFHAREAFAYAVLASPDDRYVGCVYLVRSKVEGHDCVVYLWVRDSDVELDRDLVTATKKWLNDAWPFENVAFPGREIPWADWRSGKRD